MRRICSIAMLLFILLPMAAIARIDEDGDLCWEPDIEFPVPCEGDEE